MKLFDYLLSEKFFLTILVIISIIFVISFFSNIYKKKVKDLKKTSKANLYINILNHGLKYIVILLGVLLILHINGVNVTSILASIGVISVVIGLALQDALKDYIMGFNILFDNFFQIGDVIKIGDIEGKVENFNLKTTKIRDIYTDDLYIISNRNIDKTLNISKRLDIEIPIEYEKNVEDIEKVLNKIIDKAKENKNIESIEYLGLNSFNDSAIMYKIRINCKPELKPVIKRYVNRLIKTTFEKENITIPYMQIDVYNKK